MFIKKTLISLSCFAILSGAAFSATDPKNYIEIKFKPGSATLTSHDKSAINSILIPSIQEKKIDSVFVLSWSDVEYPSKKLNKHPKMQSTLAEKRNKAVEKYVKQFKNIEVQKYNMAERPSNFSKIFNTSDTKFKDSLLAAGLSTTANSAGDVKKASHSIIVIKTTEPLY